MKKLPAFICLLLLQFSIALHISAQSQLTKGVYGNPASLLKAGYRFDSLGINAVFVRSISLTKELYKTARSQGCRVYVEFPTLNGYDYLKNNPEAWPINQLGKKAEAADWFMGVCASDSGLRFYRKQQLNEILDNYQVDGVFLDYFHWHAQFETDKPILPETCFCNRCISQFEEYIGRKVEGDSVAHKAAWILKNEDARWRTWRVSVLNRWIDDMKAVLKLKQPRALLGIYHSAWYPADHDSALKRTLGLDIKEMAERADILAPMLFHGMLKRNTAWVGEYLSWLDSQMNSLMHRPLVWPIVQAYNKPGQISPEEFRQVMLEGIKAPSTGIMMFEEGALLQDRNKLQIMREIYREAVSSEQ